MEKIAHTDIIARWTDPAARPLFKGSLIDESGCCCAQGDILRTYCGYSDQMLRDTSQAIADKEVAERLGIPLFQAVLLRNVNDKKDGCPEDVLRAPEKIIGDQAHIMLAFARHLDRMTPEQWAPAMAAARAAAMDAAWAAAMDAAWAAARAAAMAAAMDAAWAAVRAAAMDAARTTAWAAGYAINEIQSAAIMRKNGTPFYFLPMFGFATPKDVMIEDAKHSNPL